MGFLHWYYVLDKYVPIPFSQVMSRQWLFLKPFSPWYLHILLMITCIFFYYACDNPIQKNVTFPYSSPPIYLPSYSLASLNLPHFTQTKELSHIEPWFGYDHSMVRVVFIYHHFVVLLNSFREFPWPVQYNTWGLVKFNLHVSDFFVYIFE